MRGYRGSGFRGLVRLGCRGLGPMGFRSSGFRGLGFRGLVGLGCRAV